MNYFCKVIRFYGFTVIIAVLFTGCIKTIDEIPIELTVSAYSMTFPPSGGEQNLTIVSNTNNWTVSSSASSWLALSPENGEKEGTIKIIASTNWSSSTRFAAISADGTGVQTQTIHVLQLADTTVFGNDITAASGYGGGNGAQNDPYLINNSYQLKKFVDEVNNGNTYPFINFKLMSDIHVTADEWVPIGNNNNGSAYFRGTFDGNGHSIKGIMTSSRFENYGFFGVLRTGARISNLTIAASVRNEGEFYYPYGVFQINTGAIAGEISDENVIIINCQVTNDIKGGNENEYLYSYSMRSNTGGIIGYNNGGIIQNCEVSGVITAGYARYAAQTGGITGYNSSGEIDNCTILSTASITVRINEYGDIDVGGIAGVNYDRISNCTNHASISGTNYVGGLVGLNFSLNAYDRTAVIHTGLNTGGVSGAVYGTNTGGLAGWNSEGMINSCCTNSGKVNGQTANENNQIGSGNKVVTCPDGHTKR